MGSASQFARGTKGRTAIKKLVSIFVILGALAYMAILSIVVPAPSTNRDEAKAERKLAYEQTIAESASQAPADAAEQPWQATVEASEPATAEIGAEVTASLDQPESRTDDSEQPGTEDEEISMPVEQEARETEMTSELEPTGSLPEEPQEEWVQIAISGASMYSGAADDATVLFAFPSGRRLKVVSREEGWLQVTDPQSNTTGWMKAAYLAPVAPAYTQEAQTYEYRERPNWFRRQREGMGGMINRALGGW
jgi:cytoskeletal protein RodZ